MTVNKQKKHADDGESLLFDILLSMFFFFPVLFLLMSGK